MRLKDWSRKESYRSNDAGWSKHTHIHTGKEQSEKDEWKNGWVRNRLHGNKKQHKKRMKNALSVQKIILHTLSCECTATAHTLTHSVCVCVCLYSLCAFIWFWTSTCVKREAQPGHGWFVLHTRALTDGHLHTRPTVWLGCMLDLAREYFQTRLTCLN